MAFRFDPRHFRPLVLAAIGIVLALTVASFWSLQRKSHPAGASPAKIAPEVNQQTQLFSLSKTLGDRTLYTVRARRVTYFKDTSKVRLHGVSIVLYGKDGLRQDRIESQECEFDPNTSALFISGEVQMEFGIPSDPSATSTADQHDERVRVVTSGLSFDQNTGTTSTDQDVRFWFARGEGSSVGATYNPQEQWLRLKSSVRISLQDSSADAAGFATVSPDVQQNTPQDAVRHANAALTQVQASSLDFRIADGKVLLGSPVEVTKASRVLRAGAGEIWLDAEHRAKKALLMGGVFATDQTGRRSSEIRSRQTSLEFSAQGKLKTVQFEKEVGWTGAQPDSRREGSAGRVELQFSEPASVLARIIATDDVQITLSRARRSMTTAAPTARRSLALPDAKQILTTEAAEMDMSADGTTLQKLTTRSTSTLELLPSRPGEDEWKVEGTSFGMQFTSEGDLAQFAADGGVRVTTHSTQGPSRQRVSTSDHLSLQMDAGRNELAQVEQRGHFAFKDAQKEGSAERAVYSADGDQTVLAGNAVIRNRDGKVSAQRITVHNETDDVEADGSVSSSYFPSTARKGEATLPFNVVADRLRYLAATEWTQYEGRVRLWQGRNLLEADWLELDRRQGRVQAREGVYSIFEEGLQAQLPSGTGRGAGQQVPQRSGPVEIRSDAVIYEHAEEKAVYRGNVQMKRQSMLLTASELELFFRSSEAIGIAIAPFRVERAIAHNPVTILDSGRKATGKRADYSLETGRVILTGSPAVVTDPQRGATQGARLTYHIGDDTIFVEGEPGLPTETRRQVHP